MTRTMIWSPIERGLWGLALGMGIFTGILYYIRAKQTNDKSERRLMFGFAAFFFLLSFSRIFYFLSDLQVEGTFNVADQTFYGDFNNVSTLYELFIRTYYIIGGVGVIAFILINEQLMKRTKHIITIIHICLWVSVIFLPFELAHSVFNSIFFPFFMLIFIVVFFLYTKYAQPEFKAIAPIILIGIMIGAVSLAIGGPEVKQHNTIPLIIAPILYFLTNFLSITPLIFNPKYFSRKFVSFLILSLIIITGAIMLMILGSKVPIVVSIWILVLIMFSLFSFYKIFKVMRSKKVPIDKSALHGILRGFTRPQRISEEEVSISKEKGICLVCKGEILRENYICPNCKSFYCVKCSENLTNLENACWVCDTPFDESKPVKLSEEMEEEIAVNEEYVHKKTK